MDEFYNDHIQNGSDNANGGQETPEVNFVMRGGSDPEPDNGQSCSANDTYAAESSFSESDTFRTSQEAPAASSYDYSYYQQEPRYQTYNGGNRPAGRKPKKKDGTSTKTNLTTSIWTKTS